MVVVVALVLLLYPLPGLPVTYPYVVRRPLLLPVNLSCPLAYLDLSTLISFGYEAFRVYHYVPFLQMDLFSIFELHSLRMSTLDSFEFLAHTAHIVHISFFGLSYSQA